MADNCSNGSSRDSSDDNDIYEEDEITNIYEIHFGVRGYQFEPVRFSRNDKSSGSNSCPVMAGFTDTAQSASSRVGNKEWLVYSLFAITF